jgi:hypothetical protein
MPLKNRVAKKLLSTWPQRLALSGVAAFIAWSLTGENLLVFLSAWLVVHLILTIMNSRIPDVKANFNEEMRY